MDWVLFFKKTHKELIIGPLTQVINLAVMQGIFPCSWKYEVITLIHKSGNYVEISNYRPISILPVMSKVVEKLVAEQLITYLNNSAFCLHPMQFGYRKKYRNCKLFYAGKY